ncbi:hypothetical protein D9M71_595050 [compost metagenome]
MPGSEQREKRLVVDVAQQRIALLTRGEITQVGAEYPVPDGFAVLQANEALLVDVLQLTVPKADAALIGIERIIPTHIVERVAFGLSHRHMAKHRVHLAVATFVAQVGAFQVPGLHSQPVDFRRTQTQALIGGWQQANITESQHRQVRLQFTCTQFGF